MSVPNVSTETGQRTQAAFNQVFATLQQHEQAFAALKTQVDAKATPTASAATTAATLSQTAATTKLPLGTVNTQFGTSYTLQDSDYGGLVVLGNAQPVTLTLNSACRQYWLGAVENLGAAAVTVQPQSGTVNEAQNLILGTACGAWLFYDGSAWWAVTTLTPAAFAAVSHQFLTSYNAGTGVFTAAQPSFADLLGTATADQVPAVSALHGQINAAQLPVAGASGQITLAALSAVGTQGSLTFQDGLLTAFTAPS